MEIQKLKDSIENSVVESEMAGVVKSINDGSETDMYGNSQAFMTIIAMGDFRVKGMINEQNMGSIMEGQPVLVHSRVDEDVVWNGTIGSGWIWRIREMTTATAIICPRETPPPSPIPIRFM